MMRATRGTVPAAAQQGLKDSWKAQGYFLPCVCVPDSDLTLATVGDEARTGAVIAALEPLSTSVMRVRLHCDRPLDFRPGQYCSVMRDDGLARSYSIASLPSEGDLELHVRRVENGRMSGWLHEGAHVGDRVTVQGPSGECFYVPGQAEQSLLLVGTGTGLAPLWGILRDALRSGHRGPIHLFHGAVRREGLYLVQEIQKLIAGHPQVTYTPAVLDEEGPVDQVLLSRLPKLAGWRAYVCGDPGLVRTLKKKIFLAGAASKEIFADAFLPAAP
jgi:NAD(P)H-flavin reductase